MFDFLGYFPVDHLLNRMSLAPLTKIHDVVFLERLVPHIFFPRQLPSSSNKEKLVDDESKLLELFDDALQRDTFPPDATHLFQSLRSTFHTWSQLQGQPLLDSSLLSESIQNLQAGDALALYIRAQNAGLLIKIPREDGESATIFTFAASLPNAAIMSASGNLIVRYPSTAIRIKRSQLLHSKYLADQLSALHKETCDIAIPKSKKAGSEHEEVRDVADPIMISKWFSLTVTTKDAIADSKLIAIQKKMRDQVVWRKTFLPFRRSGMWMTIKVICQLLLNNNIDHVSALFYYKLILLEFMLEFHQLGILPDPNIDLCMQILAKLSRRLFKVEQYLNSHKSFLPPSCPAMYQAIAVRVCTAIETVRVRLETKWKAIIAEDRQLSRIDAFPSFREFHRDIKHPVSEILSEIAKASSQPRPSLYRRTPHFEDESCVEIIQSKFLYSIEHTTDVKFLQSGCVSLRDSFFSYVDKGKQFYSTTDPLGGSRMILTCLRMLRIFDQIACSAFPLLKEHKTGIEQRIFSELLLPTQSDMITAQEIEQYFQRRDSASHNLPPLEEAKVSENSFSARFAPSNSDMCNTLAKILAEAEVKENEKRKEVATAKLKCDQLRKEAALLTHERGTRRHLKSCKKCILDRQAEYMSVRIYERPLKPELHYRYAVVFELRIPIEIACLRDALAYFDIELSGAYSANHSSEVFGTWCRYQQISHHNAGKQAKVELGSTQKTLEVSHYSVSQLHPDSPESSFITDNAQNCVFVVKCTLPNCRHKSQPSSEIKLADTCSVKNYTTLEVEGGSPYSSLPAWAVQNATHNQNQIIAQKSTCPTSLSLCEFVEFGSIRAGHRLQLRNIYRALEQRTLTLKSKSVLALILEALWEAGPPNSGESFDNSWIRDSHVDLLCPEFTAKLVDELESLAVRYAKNWQDHTGLLVPILISARIVSLNVTNETIANRAVKCLIRCRGIAMEWTVDLERLLAQTSQLPPKEVQELRLRVIEASICAILTFLLDLPRSKNSLRSLQSGQ